MLAAIDGEGRAPAEGRQTAEQVRQGRAASP